MTEIHRGGCLCGSVRYRTLGQPVRTTICHCTFCQRLTGSAMLIEPVFLKTNFEIEQGELSAYVHRSPDHGRVITVQFCSACGTHLGLLFERFPTMIGLCGGTFDDPHWFEPSRHIFTRSAVRWMMWPPGIDCYERHTLREDGSAEIPWRAAIRERHGPA